MNLDKFSLNGEIVSMTNAVVPISNIEYQYGFGVYETIRVIKEVPYFVKEHVERLLYSAQIIGIKHNYSAEDISKNITSLITAIESDTAYNLKILLIGADTADRCLLYIVPLSPLFPDKKIYKRGVSLVTVGYERMLPQAKTLNMLGSYLAYRRAKQGGHRDALLVSREGFITEGTRSNFFLIRDRAIFTPSKSLVLDGVTRRTVLYVATQNGFTVKEKNVLLSELVDYDGAFITNTSDKIVPVSRVDDFCFSSIPQSVTLLIQLYDEYLEKYNGTFVK